ncbi:hypothetical protein L486_08084 [Kwoniella mangroviensis CBS 10435]|uniref:SWIM-type domain-containing protein n=1 Tax=Kwoniella mangroviensis CBS 10435 TaxID=1331196 RepID=A0A1B9IGL2_9TREE|nr:hypothetical protein L486_08084 [Kwoniella mangroviensis CBS 10435]
MTEPSSSFLILVATLLDSLPPFLPITDTLLLQLHAVFGSMLLSALQLVDKREVVRVSLPSDRYVYQVASSSGKNYTIHLNPPPPTTNLIPDIPSPEPTATPPKEEADLLPPAPMGESIPRTPSPTGSQIQTFNPLLSSPAQQHRTPSPASPLVEDEDSESISQHTISQKDILRRERIARLADDLKSMYCPCAGWSYGCLAGEKTILCKHLLAVIIASKIGREVRADGDVRGAAGLLGLT